MTADELTERLPWPKIVDALEAALEPAFESRRFYDRRAVAAGGGELLLMPAADRRAVGVKLAGVGLHNADVGLPRIQALYVLFDGATLSPVAIIDGARLTTIRTAGQSAMVVRRIAPADARSLVVFGSGPQARAHVEAVCAVRPIDTVRVVGRRPEPVTALCSELDSDQIDVRPAGPEAVTSSDIVVCATNSSTSVLDGATLPEEVCVVAVGSHTPDARELDDTVFSRAGLVLVEDTETALREAGDVIQAMASGVLRAERIRDFADLATTTPDTSGITVYKSVGMGYQDLAVVEAALATELAAEGVDEHSTYAGTTWS